MTYRYASSHLNLKTNRTLEITDLIMTDLTISLKLAKNHVEIF